MDKKLLTILCCPVTRKSLNLAHPDLLASINSAIGDGRLVNREGGRLTKPLTEALVTDDGKLLYPVDDGIPVLLESESVSLESL
jgi:uncharacterized protein YbaR (Trm112 family)